jgi:hypothetical protein
VLKLYQKFNVMSIRSCGVLSVHLVIGICAGLSLFPAHLLSHAEVPPNTGYEKIFEGSNVSAAKDDYAKKSHYEHSQDVLKATAVNINVTVATGEEVICQVKNVNTSQPLCDDEAVSCQIPTDAKAADYAFSGVPYMLYNTNTHIIEGWWGRRLDGTRIMLPVRPLWFIEEALKLETHKLKKGFFKATWPMKQKNKVVKRSRPTEKPLLSMCSLKNMGQIKENNNNGGQVSVETIAKVMCEGKCDVILQKGNLVYKYKLDFQEPDPIKLFQRVEIFSPQRIVYRHFRSMQKIPIDELYEIDRRPPPKEYRFPRSYLTPMEGSNSTAKTPPKRSREQAALDDGFLVNNRPSCRRRRPFGFFAEENTPDCTSTRSPSALFLPCLAPSLHRLTEPTSAQLGEFKSRAFATIYSSAYMQGCFAGLFAMVEVPQYSSQY